MYLSFKIWLKGQELFSIVWLGITVVAIVIGMFISPHDSIFPVVCLTAVITYFLEIIFSAISIPLLSLQIAVLNLLEVKPRAILLFVILSNVIALYASACVLACFIGGKDFIVFITSSLFYIPTTPALLCGAIAVYKKRKQVYRHSIQFQRRPFNKTLRNI